MMKMFMIMMNTFPINQSIKVSGGRRVFMRFCCVWQQAVVRLLDTRVVVAHTLLFGEAFIRTCAGTQVKMKQPALILQSIFHIFSLKLISLFVRSVVHL